MGRTSTSIIEAALDRLAAEYVFEGKTAEVAAFVRARLAEGAYERLDGEALCEAVTSDFQQITGDKHLRLLWMDEAQEIDGSDQEDEDFFADLARSENQGVRRVKRLDGDIGYIETTLVAEPGDGAAVISAAMTLVANT